MIKNLLQRNKLMNVAAIIVVVAIMIVACKKDEPAPSPAPPVKPAAVAPAKPIQKPVSSVTSLKLPDVNQFDFSNKKDPFKPFVAVKPVEAAPDSKKALREGLPIHQFDVSQFKLIGIVTGGSENKAMVVDAKGKGYVVKVGMTIGKNDGKITSINSDGITVVELFKDDNGRVRKENIKITLPRKQ